MRNRGLLGLSLLMVVCLLMAGFLQLYAVTPQVVMASPDSTTCVPDAQHATNDTTGDSLSGITGDDATENPDALSKMSETDNVYTVDKDKVMYLDTFDVSSIPEGATITAAVLHLQYGAEDGYTGTNSVSYDNGTGLTTTGITLTDITGWSADLTFDLYGAGVDTKSEIQNVDIEFTNDDPDPPADAIHFDYVWIEVTYTPPQPPTVNSVTLTDTSMTPQTEYSVTVTVSDADNLSDLTTVVLKVYYDTDTTTNETEYDGKTADTQSCAIITYTLSGDSFAIDPSADTTWSLGACEAFTSGEKGSTSGDCIFVFTLGKVATETGTGECWQIAAKATDSASLTGWNYDETPGATMAWYGEIDVPDATADWGFVVPGLDFGEDTASEEAVGVTITYISNGAYDKKVKTTSPWSGSSYTATLDSTGACSSANEFALKADDTGSLSSAVLVDTSGAIIDNTGGQTTEAGDQVTTHTLWLKLASSFDSDTYSGTITYIIAEHV